jgi:hypothetical protein
MVQMQAGFQGERIVLCEHSARRHDARPWLINH